MHGHPTQGVKNAKPRLFKLGPRISELSEEYQDPQPADAREGVPGGNRCGGDAKATYLLVAMRQKILNLPQTYARRWPGRTSAKSARCSQCRPLDPNEIKDLPNKVTDPNWLESLEEE